MFFGEHIADSIAPCAITCDSDSACDGLEVRTNGTCVRPHDCTHTEACKGMDLSGCATVRAPDGHPELKCGVGGCAGAVIPLGAGWSGFIKNRMLLY